MEAWRPAEGCSGSSRCFLWRHVPHPHDGVSWQPDQSACGVNRGMRFLFSKAKRLSMSCTNNPLEMKEGFR